MEDSHPISQQQSVGWLLGKSRQVIGWVVLSIGLGLGSGLLIVLQATLISRVICGAFIDNLPPNAFVTDLVAITGVVLIRSICAWAREEAGFRAGAGVRRHIRKELLEHVFALGPGYTSRKQTGDLASVSLAQVEGLHDFFARYLPQLAIAVLVPAAILFFVFPISWAAGGLLLLTAPMIPLFMVLVGMGAESVSQRHFQALARLGAHFLDVLQGLSTLKLLGRSRQEEAVIAETSRDYRVRTMKVLRIAFISSAVLEFFASISIALVAVFLGLSFLGYITYGAYGHMLTLQQGLFILLLAPEFYMPLRELGAHYHARAEAVGAVQEIVRILNVLPSVLAGTRPLTAQGGIRMHFEDVHFAFDGGKRPVLQGTTFTIRPGERVALVGATGQGKTTIVNLILGFLQPDQGRIRVNENSLSEVDLEQWRRHIAWVGQQPVLFSGTVEDNIRLARPGAGDAEIEAAARAARVLEFTRRLPQGLDTVVGEQGFGLSRGQAQRLALARAFLKDAPLVLLDEPTAGLDSENEALVLAGLAELVRDKSVCLITHRLASMAGTDRVLVLESGKILESGTFAELMASDSILNRLAGSDASRGSHGPHSR